MAENTTYFVYYSTANNRPKKYFGADREAAIEWAKANREKRTEVIECRPIWSARESS